MSTKTTANMSRPRYADLDFLRIIATVAVVIIHCAAPLVLDRPYVDKTWILGNLIDSAVRWSVPIFIMVSGALLISPKAADQPLAFLRRRLERVLIPFCSWIILYQLFMVFYLDKPFDLRSLWLSILGGSPYPGHLYFLPLIAGLYIITPLITPALTRFSTATLWRCTLSILVATALWHLIETFALRGGPAVNILSQWIPYVGYYLLGHLLIVNPPSIRLRWVLATAVAGTVAIALLTRLFIARYNTDLGVYFYNFPTPFVMIVAPSIFIGGRRLYTLLAERFTYGTSRELFEKRLSTVAGTTFGIYLTHIAIINILGKELHLLDPTIWDFVLLTPLVVVTSYIVSKLISRIPRINKLLIP